MSEKLNFHALLGYAILAVIALVAIKIGILILSVVAGLLGLLLNLVLVVATIGAVLWVIKRMFG
ncbi:MAG: hypothetical protein QGH20_10490 [Candidatus Latescibacteria bacterium]|jgi:hypothetical protein|nr:hypothetical protein [Candidatus Latescibacterota bacterium]